MTDRTTVSLKRLDRQVSIDLEPFPDDFEALQTWQTVSNKKVLLAFELLFSEQSHALLMNEYSRDNA
jgi:hypothetical protein